MLLSEILIDGRLPEGFPAADYGLVFGQEVYDLLMAAQTDDMHHRIAPVATTDDRWLTCCDVLLEATRGVYKAIFGQIPAGTAELVTIMPWEIATALLPEPEPLEI